MRVDVATSLLLDGLFEEAERRVAEPLGDQAVRILGYAADPRAARLGYVARIIEIERFEPARAPMPWLAERLGPDPRRSAELVSATLAEEEPLPKPNPADQPPSWLVPGPGGHVRHVLALRAIGDGPPENKRSWMLGFFARCCEEVAGVAPI